MKVPSVRPVVKLLRAAEWARFDVQGTFSGSADDLRDGFIHLSTPEQAVTTREKYFAGEDGLVEVACNADALGEALRWEASRGGALFPHLYRSLQRDDIKSVRRL
ncbi:MAG TPA: DUF952 domain-containing protein [Polymorphobacter sp.]|nr:DUF952 domain-containing protein [Polymorphobacter sp.]